MVTSRAATVILSATVTGLLWSTPSSAWAVETFPITGIPEVAIRTYAADVYRLTRSEQRMLNKALFRSAKVLHRPAAAR